MPDTEQQQAAGRRGGSGQGTEPEPSASSPSTRQVRRAHRAPPRPAGRAPVGGRRRRRPVRRHDDDRPASSRRSGHHPLLGAGSRRRSARRAAPARSRVGGPAAAAGASATRCRWPAERPAAHVADLGVDAHGRSAGSRAAAASAGAHRLVVGGGVTSRTLSATVPGSSAGRCGSQASPQPPGAVDLGEVGAPTSTRPDAGAVKPSSMSSVVLPAPLGAITAVVRPAQRDERQPVTGRVRGGPGAPTRGRARDPVLHVGSRLVTAGPVEGCARGVQG